MIKRERWIVYPLLFLVISISLKDKLNSQQKSLRLKNLKVEQLEAGTVQGAKANFRELAAPLIQTGQLNVLDKQGVPKVVLHNAPSLKDNEPDFEKTQGAITLLSSSNQEMLVLGGGDGGGFMAARSATNPKDFVAFGYQAGRVGIFWLDKNGNLKGFLKPQQPGEQSEKKGAAQPALDKEPNQDELPKNPTAGTTSDS